MQLRLPPQIPSIRILGVAIRDLVQHDLQSASDTQDLWRCHGAYGQGDEERLRSDGQAVVRREPVVEPGGQKTVSQRRAACGTPTPLREEG